LNPTESSTPPGTAGSDENLQRLLEECIFNEREFLRRFDSDMELIRELVAEYKLELPRVMGEIERAFAAGDAKGLEAGAHRLKGSVGNFAAAEALAATAKLEVLARSGDLDAAGTVLKDLRAHLERLNSKLVKYEGSK
jgi:HPt (histidine-containing phosphotransfer) domain-containing protein